MLCINFDCNNHTEMFKHGMCAECAKKERKRMFKNRKVRDDSKEYDYDEKDIDKLKKD